MSSIASSLFFEDQFNIRITAISVYLDIHIDFTAWWDLIEDPGRVESDLEGIQSSADVHWHQHLLASRKNRGPCELVFFAGHWLLCSRFPSCRRDRASISLASEWEEACSWERKVQTEKSIRWEIPVKRNKLPPLFFILPFPCVNHGLWQILALVTRSGLVLNPNTIGREDITQGVGLYR